MSNTLSVDIIIPHFGPASLLEQCLDSVKANTRIPHNVTVIDNNEDNRGFAVATNEGLRQTDGDYVVFLNNDTEVPDGWLKRMLDVLTREPGVVAIGPLATAWTQWQWLHRVAMMFKQNLPANDYVTTEDYSFPSDTITFWCTLFPRWAFDAVGMLDEQFFMFYEDNDWCRRAQEAGYHLALDLGTVVTHHHEETISPQAEKYMAESRQLYFDKWGIHEKPSVLVGVPNEGWVRKEVPQALLNILRQQNDLSRVKVLWPAKGDVVENRNLLAKIARDEGFDFLLMWDSDQAPSFNPLDFAEYDKDVIGFPTPMYKAGEDPEKPIALNVTEDLPGGDWISKQFNGNEGLTKLDGMIGTGLMLVATRVFEHPDLQAPFLELRDDDGLVELGEDQNFCRRARQAGFEVWTDPRYPSEHWNEVALLHATQQINRLEDEPRRELA